MGVLEQAIVELRRWRDCPACGKPVHNTVCAECGLQLAGEDARLLIWQSEAAARALELRQRTLARLVAHRVPRPAGRVPAPAAVSGAAPAPAYPAARTHPASGPPTAQPVGAQARPIAPPPRPAALPARPEVNPVAVFSAVGVGALVAAALVLAFLVPADPGLIRIVLLGVTIASAAATLVLRRRRPVSAAAIATGTALLCLLVIALFVRWLPPDALLLTAAAAVAGLAVGLGAAGFGLRLRPWVSAGILLAPLAAAMAAWHFLDSSELWGTGIALVVGIALTAIGRWSAHRWRGDQPGELPFAVERVLLGLGAGAALLVAVAVTLTLATESGDRAPLAAVLMLAAAAAVWLHGTSPDAGWCRIAGAVAVLAPVALVLGLRGDLLLATAAAGLGWMMLAAASALTPLREGAVAGLLKGGWLAGLLLALPALRHLLEGMLTGSGARLDDPSGATVLMLGWELPESGFAVAGLLVAAAQCAVAAALPSARFGTSAADGAPGRLELASRAALQLGPAAPGASEPTPTESIVARTSSRLWPWLGLAGLAAAAALPLLPLAESVALLLVLALGSGLVAWRVGDSHPPVQAAGRIGGGLVILGAAAASWDSRSLTLAAGAAVVALAIGWTQLVPRPVRSALAGVGYGYALILLGFALHWYPLGWQAGEWAPVAGLLAVAASLVSLGSLAVTPTLVLPPAARAGVPGPAPAPEPAPEAASRGLTPMTGYTLLGLGLVPWLLATLTVLDDRSWWAAGAAASMLVVEIVATARRRPQPTWLRVLAAMSLLPTAGILLINAGAMLIPSSGSPILLPIVAALASGTAITAGHWAGRVAGIDARAAGPIRRSFEWGALLTALASVLLAIILPAAGAGTALVVCAILAAGASVVATQPDRRRVAWLAALAASGALWSALVLLEVGLVEAYTLPIGLVAVAVGLVLTRRRPRWWALVAAGLQLALLPSWLLAALGRDLLVRSATLTGVAVGLAVLTLVARRGPRAGSALWVLAGGLAVTGTAPLWVAIRSSGHLRPADPALTVLLANLDANPLVGFAWVVATASVSAGLLGFAGQAVRWATGRSRRWRRVAASWRFAPALAVAASGLALAVRPSEGVVLAMWLACLGFLGLTVVSTLLRLQGRVILPPVWYCWLMALGVGIAGWSLRELRVEFHALPLGLILLACGVLAWRAAERGPVLPDRSWPIGQADPTWAILPGVLATLGPSTLAIGTDPQTWRAILVLVMALAALLVGARKLWRPCLVTGIVDLAVAVLLVFVARRGAIDAVPWLIALVSAGGVLLGLAVYSERRQHAVAEKE